MPARYRAVTVFPLRAINLAILKPNVLQFVYLKPKAGNRLDMC